MVDALFPIVTGPVIAGMKAGLVARDEPYTENVVVQVRLPHTKSLRMVTVRDDGGPVDGIQLRKQLGWNVWAETAVNAERLALMCMAILQTLPDGDPITHVDNMSGPFEVIDESTDLLTVGSVTLSHYFFTARVSVRGEDI